MVKVREAWHALIHGDTNSQIKFSDWTTTTKAIVTYKSSVYHKFYALFFNTKLRVFGFLATFIFFNQIYDIIMLTQLQLVEEKSYLCQWQAIYKDELINASP